MKVKGVKVKGGEYFRKTVEVKFIFRLLLFYYYCDFVFVVEWVFNFILNSLF